MSARRAVPGRGLGPARELTALTRAAAAGWRSGRRPWVAVGLTAATALADLLLHLPPTQDAVRSAADVRADLPLLTELVRLPASALVPTADLPLWAAMGQLLLVVGLAELLLPRRQVVAVACAGHILPTLAVRWMVRLGPDNLVGLPVGLAGQVDTGPSALTTAVGAYLLVRSGARGVTLLLAAALVVADRVSPGVDGREHLLALAVGVAAALVPGLAGPRTAGEGRTARLRTAALAAALVAVVATATGAYHPIRTSSAVRTTEGGDEVVALRDPVVPVDLDALPAGIWLSASPTCTTPAVRNAGWLWRRPTYLCTASRTLVRLRYRLAGVPESQVV